MDGKDFASWHVETTIVDDDDDYDGVIRRGREGRNDEEDGLQKVSQGKIAALYCISCYRRLRRLLCVLLGKNCLDYDIALAAMMGKRILTWY